MLSRVVAKRLGRRSQRAGFGLADRAHGLNRRAAQVARERSAIEDLRSAADRIQHGPSHKGRNTLESVEAVAAIFQTTFSLFAARRFGFDVS